LVLAISDADFDDNEHRTMSAGFDGYFARGERYALLWMQAPNGRSPGLRERAQIAGWIAHPRVRDFTKRLCVGAAAVVPNSIVRGALSAIMMVAKPPTPFNVVSTPAEGIDRCFEYLAASGLSLPKPKDLIRREALLAIG
jgi:hypothetical protein